MLNVLFFSFQKDFYSGVSSVFDVSGQLVLDCGSVDEGAEAYALDDAGDFDFEPHSGHLLSLVQRLRFHIHFDGRTNSHSSCVHSDFVSRKAG